MPSWAEVLEEVKSVGGAHDVVRRKYLKELPEHTKRNIIAYYSDWLQLPGLPAATLSLTDSDKNGFMACVHGMDRSNGLDLLLHTPGGSTAATESIIDYLCHMFGHDIRAIIPQLAMSAGTMIALGVQKMKVIHIIHWTGNNNYVTTFCGILVNRKYAEPIWSDEVTCSACKQVTKENSKQRQE